MEENKEQQQNDENLKVLRTYTSDMADVIRDNEISAIKIAMDEKEKKDQNLLYRKSEGSNVTKIIWIIGGVILIIVAILGSYFLLKKNKIVEVVPITISDSETFISYDTSSYIDVTDINNVSDLSNLISKENQTNIKSVEAIFLTKKVNDISQILSSSDFLSLIGSTAPAPLIRSLSNKYLLGKYLDSNNSEIKNNLFLILETTNYNQAYASMLAWEKTMLKDLSILFNIEIKDNTIFEKQWKDVVINNKDARVLYDEEGEEMLCYLFVNNNDFIIANNLNTLEKILQKVLAKSN